MDAYSQTTGACGSVDFLGNCWEWTSSTDANGLYIIKGAVGIPTVMTVAAKNRMTLGMVLKVMPMSASEW